MKRDFHPSSCRRILLLAFPPGPEQPLPPPGEEHLHHTGSTGNNRTVAKRCRVELKEQPGHTSPSQHFFTHKGVGLAGFDTLQAEGAGGIDENRDSDAATEDAALQQLLPPL